MEEEKPPVPSGNWNIGITELHLEAIPEADEEMKKKQITLSNKISFRLIIESEKFQLKKDFYFLEDPYEKLKFDLQTQNDSTEIPLKADVVQSILGQPCKILMFNQELMQLTPDSYAVKTIEQSLDKLYKESIDEAIPIDEFNGYTGSFKLSIFADETYLNYVYPCRYITFQKLSLINPPEDMYKKYKIVKPKEDDGKKKGKAPDPLKALNAAKAKIDKDNEKIKFCALIYIPELDNPREVFIDEGKLTINEETFDWSIEFPGFPCEYYLSNPSMNSFIDMITNEKPFSLIVYKMEYKDKQKVWEIVEGTFSQSNFILSPLSVPESVEYEDTSALLKGSDPRPPPPEEEEPVAAKGKSGSRKSMTKTPSRQSKTGGKTPTRSASGKSKGGEEVNFFEGSSLYLHFTLNETLFYPPPTPPRPDRCLNDLVKHNPVIAKKDLPKPAYVDFREEVNKTVDLLVNEFITVNNNSNDVRDISRGLLFKLNDEGTYFKFKEKLKGPLVALVHEKYSQEEMKDPKFIGLLYTYVMEQVTRVLNDRYLKASISTVLNRQDFNQTEEIDPKKELQTLLILSEEAELIDNFELAKSYQLNRIHICEEYGINDSRIWKDYGKFLLRINEKEQAVECFRRSLEISTEDTEILYLYCMLLFQKEIYEDCEVILYEIRDRNPDDIKVWILLTTLYERFKRESHYDRFYKDTMRLINNDNYTYHMTLCDLFYNTCLFDEALKEYELCNESNTEDGSGNNNNNNSGNNLAQIIKQYTRYGILLYNNKDYEKSINSFQIVLKYDPTNAEGYEYTGYCLYYLNNIEECQNNFVQAVYFYDLNKKPLPMKLSYILSQCYMKSNNYTSAKEILLRVCGSNPNATLWLNVGICCIQLSEFKEAEESLCEANLLDNRNSVIWGYLCLLSLWNDPPKYEEAKKSLENAKRYNLDDINLLNRLAAAYYHNDHPRIAEELVKRALKIEEQDDLLELCGNILKYQNKLKECKQYYQKYLQHDKQSQNPNQRQAVVSQYCDVLRSEGYNAEADAVEESERE